MLCLGHPIRRQRFPRHEIDALPKDIVDQIPLVLYIPSPPDGYQDQPLKEPSAAHTFPPKPPAAAKPKRRYMFKMLKRKKTKAAKDGKPGLSGDNDAEGDKDKDQGTSWEDTWIRSELPFVRLEENRAACAICLLDFEEPERKVPLPSATNEPQNPPPQAGNGSGDVQEVSIDPQAMRLEDAGEGAQPLRLLACGHVFHVRTRVHTSSVTNVPNCFPQKTCVDPWLIDIRFVLQ
jgi:hypothetical protein